MCVALCSLICAHPELGHANVSTTRLYGRRKTQLEDSPTFHVKYFGRIP
jgi:hypothetical protein